jgi:hypothetical protein
VEDQDGVELVGHGVVDEALEAGALVGGAAGLKVQVLVDQRQLMVGGVAADRLALPVGGVAATLLLG